MRRVATLDLSLNLYRVAANSDRIMFVYRVINRSYTRTYTRAAYFSYISPRHLSTHSIAGKSSKKRSARILKFEYFLASLRKEEISFAVIIAVVVVVIYVDEQGQLGIASNLVSLASMIREKRSGRLTTLLEKHGEKLSGVKSIPTTEMPVANGIEINLVGRFFDRKGRESGKEREFGKRGGIRTTERRRKEKTK